MFREAKTSAVPVVNLESTESFLQVLLPFTVLRRLELTKVEKSNISTITDARNFLQKKNIETGSKQILQTA